MTHVFRFLPTGLMAAGLGLIVAVAAVGGDVADTSADVDQAQDRTITLAMCRVKFLDEVVLSSQRPGVIDSIVVQGRRISRGDVVARLDDRMAQCAAAILQEQAKNDVEVRYAQKASELAEDAYMRSLTLNKNLAGTVTDFALHEQRLAADRALLQLEQAQHNLEVAKLKLVEATENLTAYRVIAPLSGFVRKVYKKPGEAVREAEPIIELVNTGRVLVEGFVGIDQIDRIAVGTPVEVVLNRTGQVEPGPANAYQGQLSFIDVKVEPVTRKLRVCAEVANVDNRLRDGLTAHMTMFVDPPRNMRKRPTAPRISARQ